MDNLPQTLSVWLYQHQAYRLVRKLKTAPIVSNLLDPNKSIIIVLRQNALVYPNELEQNKSDRLHK